MKYKKKFCYILLFTVLSINFIVTGLVIGGTLFDNSQNGTESQSKLVFSNQLENINTQMLSGNTLTNLKENSIQKSINTNPIISSEEINQQTRKNNPNFVILDKGQPWSSSISGYKYRKAIRIENGKVSGTSSLTNFPLLVDLFDEDLHDFTRSDGNDIVFTDYSGTKLDHEIEIFDQNYSPTQAHLVTWVRIPSLSATSDTTLFMYFNKPSAGVEENPTSVWDSNYKAIWHMNQDPTGTAPQLLDSTSNNNDGTSGGGMTSTDLVSTKIGYGLDFDGCSNGDGSCIDSTGDFISVPHSSSLDITGNQVTLEAWVFIDTDPQQDAAFMVKTDVTNQERYMMGVNSGAVPYEVNKRVTTTSGHYRYDTGDITKSEWVQTTVVYDGTLSSNPRFKTFVNGILITDNNAADSITSANAPLLIAKRIDDRYFNGILDELRISNTARSADYIKTTYNNQENPSWFYSVSSKHSQNSWPQEDFSFRKNVTISSTVVSGSSDLIDFPYLLELTDEDLKYKTLASGYDILFTDQNGAPYDHEIEIFDQTSGYLKAWIRIPTFSASTDTKLVMYYGNANALTSYENAEAVWDDNYIAVWHMSQDPSGNAPQILDSTGNNWDGTTVIDPFTSDDLVNGSIYFDDNNDGFNVGNIDSNSWNQLTLQGWINPFNSETDKIITKENTTGSSGPWSWYLGRASQNIYYRIGRDGGSSYSMNIGAGILNNEWSSLAFTWDGTITANQMKGYKDGSIVNTISTGSVVTTIYNSAYDVYIGTTGYSSYDVGGYLDEIRISNIVRSPDWLATEYNNQMNPSTYVTTQSEEEFVNIFDYRKQITIDNTQISGSAELDDFPLYFDFFDSDIKLKAQANGQDIYFADNNGTKLPAEFLEYTDNGTHIHVKVWISVNKIQPTTNTVIYMYYGNNKIEILKPKYGVGQNAYQAIYHLDETANIGGTSTIHTDSANGYNGNQNGNNNVSGKINYAQNFDGINDYIRVNSSFDLRSPNDFTISGWFKLDQTHDSSSSATQIILNKFFDTEFNFHIGLVGNNASLYEESLVTDGALVVKFENEFDDGFLWTNKNTWVGGVWYHFMVSIDTTTTANSAIYINGIDDTNSTVSFQRTYFNINFLSGWEFGVATEYDDGGAGTVTEAAWFDGTLDEIRIIDGIMNSDWAQTEYNSIDNPQQMYSIQTEERNFPYLNDFGVYDPGNGFPQYWANITGGWQGSINSATIEIDSLPFSMSNNGTYWVYAPAGVVFNTTYSYQIVNATNTLGQYLRSFSTLESYTSDKDVINPTIDGTPLYEGSSINDGLFSVNVSDSWGAIDTVLLNIIDHTGSCGPCYSPSTAVMQNNSIEFINDTISLFKGTATYQIVVNDTLGNTFNSGNQTANVLNKIPTVSNIQLIPTYLPSNSSLNLSYDYTDPENDPQSGSEIRWYKNSIHQSSFDDDLFIPSTAMTKGDIWNVSVKPRDGFIFGQLQWYSGSTIQVQNSAPEASDLTISPTIPTTSNDLVASWTFFDEDNDLQLADSWIIRWYNNVSGQIPAYDDQLTVPSSATAKDQEWWYTLQVYDGSEYSIEYSLSTNRTVIINSKPTASSVAIEGSPDTTDILNATWTFSDADSDSESSSWIIRWYRNGVLVPSLNDQISVPTGLTNKSDVWNFTLQVFDGIEYSVMYISPSKTIINSAPEANTLTITANPDTITDLVASWGYSDADGDAQNTSVARIRWYRDGVLISSLNDLTTVPFGLTNKSEVWNYTLQVFDGEAFSIIYSSGSTTIQNTAPSADSAILLTSSSTSSENLVASWTYSDIDNDAENVSAVRIRWYRDGILQSSFNDATTIPYANIARGDQWNFTVEVYDGETYSSLLPSNIETIFNSAPILLSQATFNNTSPANNADFNISISYYDQDSDTQQFLNITWFVKGAYNATLDNRTTIYQYETATGDFWFYQIAVYDGFVWSTLYTSRTIGIGQPSNNKPIAGNLTLISVSFTPFTTDNLDAGYDYYDPDNHPEYQTEIFWYMDNGTGFVLQHQHNGSFTISSADTTKGEIWKFTIVPKDVFGAPDGVGDPVNSSFITIINSVPTASSLQITINPNNNTAIMANYNPNDADNDPLTAEIRWYQNGLYISVLDNQLSVPASYTLKHDEWNFTLRLFDSTSYSIYYNSTTTMVINTAPEITGLVTITPGSPITTQNLTANWLYSDLDDDSEGASAITWYKNGVASYFNISSILSSNTKKGENWYFIIRVYDGEEYSIQHISATIQIGNTAPVASNIIFNPSAPLRGDDLQITYTWTDADQNVNDIETGTIIRWYRNGTLVPSMNDTTTIPGSLITKNYEWNVTIIPSDGTDQGMMIFASVLIGNTLPEVNSISIIPGTTTYTTSDLIASYSLTDVDGDSVTVFTILWYNNSQLVASLTDNVTVSSTLTQKHDVWYYTIQVFDGTDLSIVYQSPNTTILNSKPNILSFELTPSSPNTNSLLIPIWSYFDADNDTELQPLIRWYNNSILQTPFNDNLTIQSSATLKNQLWFYTIQVYDGEEYSTVFVSNTVQIQNTLPNANNLIFTSSLTPTTIEDLVIDYSFTDNDNDFESTSTRIFWYKNGSLQALYNGEKTIPASATSHFDVWVVTVQPHDGESFGSIVSINVSIINSKPILTNVYLTPTSTAYTTSEIILNYVPQDADNDPVVAFQTHWYIGPNNLSLSYNSSYDNFLTIFANQTLKNEWWAVEISLFDGTEWSDWSSFQIKEIRNSLPTASGFSLTPSGTLYTTDSLVLNWNYDDVDGDTEAQAYIRWFRNGLLYPSLNDTFIVPFTDTSKNDNWYVIFQVFDGFDFSQIYIIPTVTIENTIPVITQATINGNVSTTDVSTDLTLSFILVDADPLDFDRDRAIYWYKNGIYEPIYENSFSIPKENLTKGEVWFYNISIFDGQVWSANQTSFSITIINSIPIASDILFIDTENQNFIVEDENLSIIYTFIDADGSDSDQSTLQWYVNGVYKPQYDNLIVIPFSETTVGQIWSVQIIPNDGQDNGVSIFSLNKTIEDRPEIINSGFYPTNLTEGEYVFWLEIEANPVNPVSVTSRPTIGFDILIGDSFTDFTTANFNGTTNFYEIVWKYPGYNSELLGSPVNITITVTSTVRYEGIPGLISTGSSLNFVIIDTAPPRVKNVEVDYEDEQIIEDITFTVQIEELGSGVKNVTIFYVFEPILQTTTTSPAYLSSSNRFMIQRSMQLPNDFKTVQLLQINSSESGISFWSATVGINVNSSVLILYQILVADNAGNINPNAYPQGTDRSNALKYTFPIEGIPLEEVLTYVAAIVVIMIIFSFIAIKKFRSKELVGLDIEVVMENIQKMKITDKDIENSLDSHTLGVVVSFFDQRHGPIPVMQEPALLRDNFEKLVELSDLSFSAVRFVDNFEDEIQASFDFTVDERTRVSSISYAFALNRPNARGGAENLTLNILALKDVHPLISQFTNQFTDLIHKVHKTMDIDPEAKPKVQKYIKELRMLISRIVISYVELYGTTELITEESGE